MYKVSKKPWYVLIFLVWGLLIGFLFWLTRDEPLSKEAEQLLSNVQLYDASLTEHPYFDILGFDARSEIDSQVVGRLIYHQGWDEFYNSSGKKNDYENNRNKIRDLKFEYFTNDEKELLRKILIEKGEYFLYQKVLKHKRVLQSFYSEQKVLNSRFQVFMQKNKTKKPLLLSINSEYPNYLLIRIMHLLYLSDLVYKNDKNKITLYIEQLIYRSTNTEDLIEKMVLVSMISQSIMLLNQINQGENASSITISKLTPIHMSLRSSFSVEFSELSVYWDQIDSGAEGMGLFDRVNEEGDIVEVKPLRKYFLKVASSFLFLKNRTKNQEAQYYQQISKITELNPQDYKRVISERLFANKGKLKSIRNVYGQKLASISNLNWLNDSIRMHLINQKIQVFNVLSNNRQFDLKQLNQNKDGYEYYRTETELCIKSPDPNQDEEQWQKFKSCLRI